VDDTYYKVDYRERRNMQLAVPGWIKRLLLPEGLTHFVRHYFKEVTIALVLAIVAAIIVDQWPAHLERIRRATLSNNLKAVATLEALDRQEKAIGQGSGFFITTSGTLVTNFHVVKGAANIIAHLPSGAFYMLRGYRHLDEKADIAILQFDARETPSVTGPGDSDKIQVGDEVYAIGTPNGLEASVSTGSISNPSREMGGRSFIQFTASISPGSSGGGLFDREGEVIGVTAASQNISSGPQAGMAQNLNFAVPINDVKTVLIGEPEELKRGNPELYYSRGNLEDNKGHWDKAIELYNKALAVDSNYVDAYLGLAGDYYEKGRYDLEVSNYERAVSLNPGSPEAFYLLGTAYEDVGQYERSINAYEKALSLDPNHKDTLHDLSIVYLTVGKVEEARRLVPRLEAEDKGWGNELEILAKRIK
jgi:S1-C subfamily serine protease/Tfp pilus assembly protein PilF